MMLAHEHVPHSRTVYFSFQEEPTRHLKRHTTADNRRLSLVRTLIGRMFAWRVPPLWHAVAWLVPFALFVVAAIVVRTALGRTWQLDTFGRSPEYPALPLPKYWAAGLVFYGWGEETGWRGSTLPRLQARHSALASTMMLSVIWAACHIPLFSFAPGLARMGPAEVIGWYLSIVTGAVLFTWLFNSTQGSIFIPAVFHGTMDIVFVSPGPPELATVLGALVTCWGLAVLVFSGPRHLSRSGKVVAPGDPAEAN
jgi:membrane protease YdiL (CAAX protease family)